VVTDGSWGSCKIESVDQQTGEVTQKPVYIVKAENVGQVMAIDDKQIGRDMFTIMSNQQTGKIALLVESLKVDELKEAAAHLGTAVEKVKTISSDMSPSYLRFNRDIFTNSQQVVDKFHVIRHVLDAVQAVRIRIKNNLLATLPKRRKTQSAISQNDHQVLSDLELLKRTQYLLTQNQNKWNYDQQSLMQGLFARFPEIKIAYMISQEFIQWYNKSNGRLHRIIIETKLFEWYEKVEESYIKELISVANLIDHHEELIINYFQKGITNAKAERINGQIQQFISQNYGIRDKEFVLYRISKYFS